MHLETNLLSSHASQQWKKVGIKPHHGINIPLFSLHSTNSCGIGEFLDIIPLLKWCQEVGMDVIQLLPLNDTGPDSSPYSAISAQALNPIHLSLYALPQINTFPDLRLQLAELQKLTNTQRINYPVINQQRELFLQAYYNKTSVILSQSEDYSGFVRNNKWLESYSLFKSLKISRQWQPWEQWPQELQDTSPANYKTLVDQHTHQMSYHIFIQFLCFQQFAILRKAAAEKKIFIKGDIPILISRESCDVWLHRSLFIIELSAGAPPDMYSSEGQNWGFPLYDWKELELQNYNWWRERLKVASTLYDIYRIDHVVGFFRIWAIPKGLSGKEGHFVPQNPSEWIPLGEKVMNMMLEENKMLPIAEDLGTVPPEVRISLSKLGICGTKVMRWERKWNEDQSFINILDYNALSMTTVSTHDSETLSLWWQNNPEEAELYAISKGWVYKPTLLKENLFQILQDSHNTSSLFHINLLNEYFPLVEGLTWPSLMDERINTPGIISEKNWTYRFKPSIEQIVTNENLKLVLKKLVGS